MDTRVSIRKYNGINFGEDIMKKMNQKGFSIVELAIVIAVIAILAAVMIPTFSNLVEKAKDNRALQEVKSAYTATLTNDLMNSTAVVYGHKEAIVVEHNGRIVSIDTNGVPTIVTGVEPTHKLEQGKLKPDTSNQNNDS